MGLGLNPNGTKTLKTYDKVGRLDKVLHMNPGGTALWSETSRYDQRDRRTARIHHDGKADLFTYDPAGQVTAAAYGQSALILPQDPKADSVPPSATTRWDQTFAYDPAGNRSQFTEAPVGSAEPDAIRQWNYQANAANQYTAVKEITSTEPSTTEPRYDPNGNLLTDDRNTYTWDADIHLLSVTTKQTVAQVPGPQPPSTIVNNSKPSSTVSFRYDPLHRRVARLEPDGTLTHFIHDGWNVIAEYSTPLDHKSQMVNHKSPSASHVWGEDLSRTMQGAGGIGGLLSSTHNIGSTQNEEQRTKNPCLFFSYDSNGNVILLTDAQCLTAGKYKYDAFGLTLSASGPAAKLNRYRFSTKPVELVSGLAFYGYRYYDPKTGRWPSRDPIGENGFRAANQRLPKPATVDENNPFHFVANSPIGRVDYLGLHGGNPGPIFGSEDCDACREYWNDWEENCVMVGRIMQLGVTSGGAGANKLTPSGPTGAGPAILITLCVGLNAWLWQDHIDDCRERGTRERENCPCNLD
jgi:RHS repeat-associated protein